MDAIEKLLWKASLKERLRLEQAIERLIRGDLRGLRITKVENYEFCKLRVGRFRIIFHHDQGGYVIDHIRLRNEGTYKNL